MKIEEAFKLLEHALSLEKEEDIRQYEILIKELNIQQRIDKGACWFPVMVADSGWSLGEHPYLVVERTKHLEKAHKFKAGQVIRIFSEKEQGQEFIERAVIYSLKKNTMKFIFYGTQIPRWIFGGKIGIQLEFDERSYSEMESAIKKVRLAKNDRLAQLRDILLGKEEAKFDSSHHPILFPNLNKAQNDAVNTILSAQDLAIIHGPPGTGKTTTMVEAIVQLSKKESPILVCAPSNAAADLLTEKLAERNMQVLRIGNISRVDDQLAKHTIEGTVKDLPEMQEVKKLKIEAQQIRHQAEKFKRNFGHKERQERRDSYREAKDLMHHAKMLEDYIIERCIKNADVICCTLVSSNSRYIEQLHFNTVFIDEAAQALEPATWIPILKANKVILAGDPYQLPPTVKNIKASKMGLNKTLIEKAIEDSEQVKLLNIQYRMHQNIMGFSNLIFYDNQLIADKTVAEWELTLQNSAPSPTLEFIDTAGCGYDEKINQESRSYYNPDEYHILRMHLDDLISKKGLQAISIGIISPYNAQVSYIKENIVADFDHFPDQKLDVNTIDAFQGQERDVIYISLVRSNDAGEIGFLKDIRRMNVAMTRAKKKLVIIADSATICNFGFYSKFLDYVDSNGHYSTAWEWQ